MPSPPSQPQFDPGVVLLAERFDPLALLWLWFARRLVYPLIWIGITVAALASQMDDADMADIDTVSEAFRALLSPLAGFVIAIGLRLATSVVGLALAYRVTLSADAITLPFESQRAASLRSVVDRLLVTRAFRNLRWTKAVRQLADHRVGKAGRRFEVADRVVTVANVVLVVAMFAIVSIVS